jgi:hypothetical protein
MKKGTLVGIGGAALAVAMALQAQMVQAQTKATIYQTTFVRANDECIPMNAITVVNPGGINACAQTNVVTSSLSGWSTARLRMTRTSNRGANLTLRGTGFLAPAAPTKVGLQLVLRTTNNQGAPAGNKTYEDQTIICGTTAGSMCGTYFAAGSDGKFKLNRLLLNDCLTANNLNLTVGTGLVEVVDAALIDCDTGKQFAAPGLKQP